jgi:hypothetical protein
MAQILLLDKFQLTKSLYRHILHLPRVEQINTSLVAVLTTKSVNKVIHTSEVFTFQKQRHVPPVNKLNTILKYRAKLGHQILNHKL